MKKLFLLIQGLLILSPAWAIQRSAEEALSLAEKFWSERSSQISTYSTTKWHVAATSHDLSVAPKMYGYKAPAYYICNQGESAFVIISGDDTMPEVLGYSDTGSFQLENLPDNIREWLSYYEMYYEQRQEQVEQPLVYTGSFPSSVSPLLGQIKYNQDTPFNNLCPLYQGNRSMTGCVGTAMASIMRYYQYPDQGQGQHEYITRTLEIPCSLDFSTITYDWNNMLLEYAEGNYTEEQATAVAQLMYACGVGVEMDYTPRQSGAYSTDVGVALVNYQKYSTNCRYLDRNCYSATEWMDLIKTELSQQRPIYYSGSTQASGHAFVLDGYDEQNLVHVNWGWGGMNNGYFEVASLQPSSPGIGGGDIEQSGYSMFQMMYANLCPPSKESSFQSIWTTTQHLYVSVKEVALGEEFQLSSPNIYSATYNFDGKVGYILQKGDQKTVLASFDCQQEFNYGYGEFSLNATLPTDLAEGDYVLYAATKDKRDTEWQPIRTNIQKVSEYILHVKDGKCKFEANMKKQPKLNVRMEQNHTLYTGTLADFDLTIINNNTNDFFGCMYIGICTTDQDGNLNMAYALRGDQVYLKAGRTKKLHIAGELPSDLAAGTYQVCPVRETGSGYFVAGELVDTEIKEMVGQAELVSGNYNLSKEVYSQAEDLVFTTDLSISGGGNVYSGKIYGGFFNQNGEFVSGKFFDVFLEEGHPVSYEMRIPLRSYQPGNYSFVFFHYDTSLDYPYIDQIGYTIKITPDESVITSHLLTFEKSGSGRLELTDAKGNDLASGDSIQAGTEVVVYVIPDEGGKLKQFLVNGEDKKSALRGKEIKKLTLTMDQALNITAEFEQLTGIEATDAEKVIYDATAQQLIIPAGSEATVYDLTGNNIMNIQDPVTSLMRIPDGYYIVRVVTESSVQTLKIIKR